MLPIITSMTPVNRRRTWAAVQNQKRLRESRAMTTRSSPSRWMSERLPRGSEPNAVSMLQALRASTHTVMIHSVTANMQR